MLSGKTVVLGITGGIAAYKMANVASALKKLNADVHVVMTRNATQFITPLTFETLTGNRCMVDTFERGYPYEVHHIALAKRADLLLIAPATADVIAKLAHGIADDMLTTVALAATCPMLVSPAMNTNMLENPITQDNIKTLAQYGFTVIPSDAGRLACGDSGSGKLPADTVLMDYILRELAREKDMMGRQVLVTAGPTQEAIDPVRYITNHSSGKMGYAIARECMLRGAQVTLVTGRTALPPPAFVDMVEVTSAEEMFLAVADRFDEADLLVKAAAVADYRPVDPAEDKLKKGDGEMLIRLERTQDILGWCGSHRRPEQYLCGFSMETRDMLQNSRAKLKKKNLDMIVANNLKQSGAGFGVDTNIVTLITANAEKQLALMSKDDVAKALIDEILRCWK